VGVVWGGALVSSVVPHAGVSWQAHVSGAVGGVLAAWLLAGRHQRAANGPGSTGGGPRPAPEPGHPHLHESLDRALAQ